MALLSFVRRAAGAAALAAVAGGCEFLHPPTYVGGDPDQLLVHAVLLAGRDSAEVIVARVGTREPTRVTGAQVRIIGPGGTAVLSEVPNVTFECRPVSEVPGQPARRDTGCYAAAVPGGIAPGAEFRLEVDVPSGEQVRGRTVVPAPPAVQAPQGRLRLPARVTESGALRTVSPFTLRWTAEGPVSVRGELHRGWVGSAERICAASMLREGPLTAQPDSLPFRVEVYGCVVPPDNQSVRADSVEMRVSVTAYDSAYVNYFRDAEGGIPLESASSGLEGAFGLFASAATAFRHVIVYRQ
jgi:hypothetical protein